MAVKLVIVESPAKARTIGRILGTGYAIKATLGHVRDLPRSELGIDIANDFTPRYVTIKQRKKVLSELKKSAEDASAVYLATDPDREGEAISWHLVEAIKLGKRKLPIHRVVFHEITKEAVEKAFTHPRSIDMNLVDAQQARRVLDRLVGYKLSPLLWRKVQRGLSAGRVQSAALRIIVDREREIQNFVRKEYWTIEAELAKSLPKAKKSGFRALFIGLSDGKKLEIPNQQEASRIEDELKKADYSVKKVAVKEAVRQPAPPFITSTMQQEAWRKLRFTAKRTMMIAQQLYEGIPLGEEGPVGLITYMRTDSTHVAAGAVAETRDFIASKYGARFVPSHPRSFAKRGKWAQEAHEAIRPTKIHREPAHLRSYLKSEQLKLYELIWKRMVASQMAAASIDITTVEINATCPELQKEYLLRTTSSVVKFPGFMTLYSEGKDENGEEEKAIAIPELKVGDKLLLLALFPEQCFTQPPFRYTEATLIKALEQRGIGRPSTYAPIISTVQERGYVYKENGKLCPDEIGLVVNDILTQHFPKIVDLDFTAQLEEELDEIAQGEKRWVPVLRDFYTPFEETLNQAAEKIEKVRLAKPTEEICPDCGRPMVLKTGRFGKFLACTGYPDCKKTMSFVVKTGVSCPQCGKELIERTTKKRRIFYGCSGFPQCKFAVNRRPVPQSCPQCGKMLIIYRDGWVKCTACEYKDKLDESEKTGAAS
ncbi:MAG: type I DNA topoisomerase [Chloroflexi bacterium]|nr:type I DNA topoisomerase [Chloroflexota bacterium]MBL7062173.1 type I DNA topoisomerase [Dehalococcoidia bacterium]